MSNGSVQPGLLFQFAENIAKTLIWAFIIFVAAIREYQPSELELMIRDLEMVIELNVYIANFFYGTPQKWLAGKNGKEKVSVK